MNKTAKAILTIIIWLVEGGIAITSLIAGRGDIGSTIPIIGIVMGVSLLGTAAIWTSEGSRKSASHRRIPRKSQAARWQPRLAYGAADGDDERR